MCLVLIFCSGLQLQNSSLADTDSLTFIHSDVKKKRTILFKGGCKITVVLFFKGAMCNNLNQYADVNY